MSVWLSGFFCICCVTKSGFFHFICRKQQASVTEKMKNAKYINAGFFTLCVTRQESGRHFRVRENRMGWSKRRDAPQSPALALITTTGFAGSACNRFRQRNQAPSTRGRLRIRNLKYAKECEIQQRCDFARGCCRWKHRSGRSRYLAV